MISSCYANTETALLAELKCQMHRPLACTCLGSLRLPSCEEPASVHYLITVHNRARLFDGRCR
jgi:hypothetical protein